MYKSISITRSIGSSDILNTSKTWTCKIGCFSVCQTALINILLPCYFLFGNCSMKEKYSTVLWHSLSHWVEHHDALVVTVIHLQYSQLWLHTLLNCSLIFIWTCVQYVKLLLSLIGRTLSQILVFLFHSCIPIGQTNIFGFVIGYTPQVWIGPQLMTAFIVCSYWSTSTAAPRLLQNKKQFHLLAPAHDWLLHKTKMV